MGVNTMLLHIENQHLSAQYPLISLAISNGSLRGITYYEKESGKEYTAIDVSSMNELIAIVSMAKGTYEYCTGVFFNGATLMLTEKAYTLGE